MAIGDEADARAAAGEPKARIFISYSRRDLAFVDRLEPELVARGFKPLIDREEIYAFEDWWKRLETLVNQADTVIFVLSPDSVASPICQKEVAHAASLNKRFAPIVFRRVDDKAVPEALARLNFIFFDDPARFAESLARLDEALQSDIGWIRKHTEFGESARRWADAGGSASSGLLLRSPLLEEAERSIGSRPPNAPAPTRATQDFIAQSRRAATRRRNILTGSLAAGLVLALGLAAWAYRERGIAIEQRGLAERNFAAAKSTVDSVVFDMAQGLRDVQGMRVDTVRRILGRAESAVNELASRTGNDPQVRESRSAMDTLFARTYLRLGAIKLAGSYAEKGNAVARALVAAQPENAEPRHDLALNLHAVGEIAEAKGDVKAALAAYRESLDIMHALAARDAANTFYQSNLLVSLNKVGKVLAQHGDLAGALAVHQEELGINRALAAKNPNDGEQQRDLSVSLTYIGDLMARQGDLAGALAAFREALVTARALTAKDPDNTERQRDVSVTLGDIGNVLAAQGDSAGALAARREALGIARTLAGKDPGNTQWQRDIAASLNNVGVILTDQGDLPGALAAHCEELAIERALAAKDENNTDWQADIAGALVAIGDVLVAQGDQAGALASFQEKSRHRAQARRQGFQQCDLAAQRHHQSQPAGRRAVEPGRSRRRARRLSGSARHRAQARGRGQGRYRIAARRAAVARPPRRHPA